jgi:hypothetical protein
MSLRYSAGTISPRLHTVYTRLTLGDSLDEDTEVGLALVEGLGALAETTGKTVVDESGLDDLLESVLDRHRAGLVGDLGDLDLGGGGVGSSLGSSVRHFG